MQKLKHSQISPTFKDLKTGSDICSNTHSQDTKFLSKVGPGKTPEEENPRLIADGFYFFNVIGIYN